MVRKYRAADLPQCARIFREAFSEETWGCSWSRERAEMYLSDYARSEKFVGFVSETDGVICMYWVEENRE